MKRLLIRADDLGYSEGVNDGIERAVRTGLVKSVGVMANMPAAAEGVRLLGDRDIAFGLHVCISAGSPVSDEGAVSTMVDNAGRFLPSSAYASTKEDFVSYEEAYREVRAQLAHLEVLLGRRADYLDVHAVASESLLRAIAAVAKEESLPVSLLPGSDGLLAVGASRVRMSIPAAATLRRLNAPSFAMETLDAVIEGFDKAFAEIQEGEVGMTVCHPGFIDFALASSSSAVWSRPIETEVLQSPRLAARIRERGLALVDYRSL